MIYIDIHADSVQVKKWQHHCQISAKGQRKDAFMFSAECYTSRRQCLKTDVESGLILFLGNGESSINAADNCYFFRQDSSFLYFWGIDLPNLAAVIDVDAETETVFGDDPSLEDVIWTGLLGRQGRYRQAGVLHHPGCIGTLREAKSR